MRSGTAFGVLVFSEPPEVSAISATSGYCLPTLRVEKAQRKRKRKIKIWKVHGKIWTDPAACDYFLTLGVLVE